MTVAERFGANLKRCRRRVRLSQEEVAARAGLHRTEIGFLEQGKRKPRIDTLVKVAAAVEAPVDELLAGIEWVPRNSTGGSFYVAPWAVPLRRRDSRLPEIEAPWEENCKVPDRSFRHSLEERNRDQT